MCELHTWRFDDGQVKRLNISVEILVNSAGICRVGRVDSLDEEDVMAQLQLNVAGTTAITHPFAKGEWFDRLVSDSIIE